MLTLSPPNKLSSAKLLVCFSFKELNCRPNSVNMWSECQTACNSASDQDPSCLHMAGVTRKGTFGHFT